MRTFENQVAIVTGAGQGIGLEICRQLVQQGASVLLNDVDDGLARQGAVLAGSAGGTCVPYSGDVSDIHFIQQMIDEAIRTFGRVDMIVANAGITHFGEFLTYRPEEFDKVMKLNLSGTFFLAQAAARQFIVQGGGGRILFMSSVTGHQAHKNLAAYGMSKAALEMLAKTLVLELSPHKITVNALAPGATLTERTLNDPEYQDTWSRITPMGRAATTEDIAHAALFFLSPAAAHVTGQTLVIDGGWTSVSPSPY